MAILIFGALTLLSGIALIVVAVIGRSAQRKLSTWKETTGKITRSDFVDDSEGGRLTIEYEYAASGRLYRSSRIAPTFTMLNYREMSKKYPVGATATVYYNPDNPEEAVLERQQNDRATIALVVGGIATILVAAVLLFVI